jgi:hypothetical protein
MRRARFKPRAALPYAALALLAGALVYGAVLFYRAATGAEYFRVKQVESNFPGTFDPGRLLGKNIFALDLERESGLLQALCPDASSVSIIRMLPDKLYVYFSKRKPVALVKFYRYFAVDKEGYFFDPPVPAQEANLPLITGLETRIFGPKTGNRYNNPELRSALDIISLMRLIKPLAASAVARVEINNSTISAFIALNPARGAQGAQKAAPRQELLEIRFSSSGVKEKMVALSQLLSQQLTGIGSLSYIDLRFKEPLIKLKETNVKQ